MRISFLLTQSLESPSGLGRYWPLSKELVRLGHKVVILALHHDFQGLKRRSFTKHGVRVHYIGQMHVRKIGNRKFYYTPMRLLWISALATWRLMRAALQTPTDVYHLGKPHPMNGLAVLLPRWLRSRPVYLDCDDYEAASNRFGRNWQRRVVTLFEDRLPTIATGITVNTHFTAERLMRLGYLPERIIYVPNGVDRDRFSNVSDAEVEGLRQRLGLAGQKVVLYAGSMSLANHAVDLLLEAFVSVRKAEPRATLVLVGRGEDYDGLRAQAVRLGVSDAVRFAGWVSPEKVPLYYGLANVSVDPVRDDLAARARCPLKVVESLVAGTPVVTGDVGDRREMLASGGGLLVPPGNATALAQSLVEVLEDEVHSRLSAEAMEVRHQCYWDVLVHKFAMVYEIGEPSMRSVSVRSQRLGEEGKWP